MNWHEIKQAYPIGSIRNWVVKRFPPYPALMNENDLGINAVLNIIHFPNPPFKHLEEDDTVQCIVIDHSPTDKKVRLSALAEDLLDSQRFIEGL